ncbi:MAG: hypothetical protein PHE70_03320 [Tepidanaerobacteraceae bacterium]|nr:hypothetical protein [Tepidanaerobacteraceae bacterium]
MFGKYFYGGSCLIGNLGLQGRAMAITDTRGAGARRNVANTAVVLPAPVSPAYHLPVFQF